MHLAQTLFDGERFRKALNIRKIAFSGCERTYKDCISIEIGAGVPGESESKTGGGLSLETILLLWEPHKTCLDTNNIAGDILADDRDSIFSYK